jgi:hypothetical protein
VRFSSRADLTPEDSKCVSSSCQWGRRGLEWNWPESQDAPSQTNHRWASGGKWGGWHWKMCFSCIFWPKNSKSCVLPPPPTKILATGLPLLTKYWVLLRVERFWWSGSLEQLIKQCVVGAIEVNWLAKGRKWGGPWRVWNPRVRHLTTRLATPLVTYKFPFAS